MMRHAAVLVCALSSIAMLGCTPRSHSGNAAPTDDPRIAESFVLSSELCAARVFVLRDGAVVVIGDSGCPVAVSR